MRLAALAMMLWTGLFAQEAATRPPASGQQQQAQGGANDRLDQVLKHVDDLMWRELVGDIAEVDKVYSHVRQIIGTLGETGAAQVSASNLKGHRKEFADLRNGCVLLAKAIERMPREQA